MRTGISIAVVLLVLFLLFNHPKLNPKKTTIMHYTPDDAKTAIIAIKNAKGIERAKLIEQIMRLETAHFMSGQYVQTGSAGMEIGKWSSLPLGVGDTTITAHDPIEGPKEFIVWPSVTAFAIYLSDYIDRFNGLYSRWNSTDPIKQAEYQKRVQSIIPRFV